MSQFPVVGYLDEKRSEFYRGYKYPKPGLGSAEEKLKNWLAHKAISIISLPTNWLATAIGCLGVLAGVCTIGAFKIAVYAITLGNVRIKAPTGVTWFGARTLSSFGNIVCVTFDALSDLSTFCSKCIELAKTTLKLLHLDKLYKLATQCFERLIKCFCERFGQGLERVRERERPFSLTKRVEPIFCSLNRQRERFAAGSSKEYDERSFKEILGHTLLSMLNIPVNAVALACFSIASVILTSVALGEALFYAITGIDIPLPTLCYYSLEAASIATHNLFSNSCDCIVDIPITLYKLSKATGTYRALVTIKEIVAYIPTAIFETRPSAHTP